MKIANIISTTSLILNDNFNIVQIPEEKIDGLPTLYVGYDLTNKYFPNFDVTEIALGNNNFWTLKKTEKRDKFQEDIDWFINYTYMGLIKDINYVFVDNIQHNKPTLRKIYRKILTSKHITFYNNDMVYMFHDKLIFGLDLKLFKYCGYNLDKLNVKIKKLSKKIIYPNLITKEHLVILDSLNNERKYIPIIFDLLEK